MAVSNVRQRVSYGLTDALLGVFPSPIISQRAPTTADKSQLGQEWIDVPNDAVYILTSIVNNLANWVNIAGGAGIFSSLIVTPGPISLTGTTTINTSGAANTTIGTGGTGAVNIGNATGNTSVTGTLTATGNITSTTGQLITINNAVSVGTTVASALSSNLQFLKSRTGGIITTGDTLGNIIFSGNDGVAYITGAAITSNSSGTIGVNRIPGNLEFYTHPDAAGAVVQRMTISTAGNVVINAPDSGVGLTVANGGITATAGDITATVGDVIALAGGVFGETITATGDLGGVNATTSVTNVVDTNQSSGVLSILSTTVNAGNNTGFLKIYVGATVAYVPYFTNIAP